MLAGWEQRLADHVQAAYGKEFKWGEHDCALFVGDWALLATGNEWVKDWRGHYICERSARLLAHQRGFGSFPEIIGSYLDSIEIKKASRGDILLHPSGALGVCTGVRGVFPTSRGVITELTSRALEAWKMK